MKQVSVHRAAGVADQGELLVAILRDPADLGILREQGWYRIPVASAPKRWPPRWLAFYQPRVFGDDAYAVRYFGPVRSIRVVPRRGLFPHEFENPKSDRPYYQVFLESLDCLPAPIYSRRLRRIVFIPTTWLKFEQAAEINDLFDESPLEDRLWAELKRLNVSAERQWELVVDKARYFLDFAVFCTRGQVAIETDGDTWHKGRIEEDNYRQNALEAAGWHVLRFNGHQIRESLVDYCVPQVARAISKQGGLTDDGMVPRSFHPRPEGVVQQLSLFEEGPEYDLD